MTEITPDLNIQFKWIANLKQAPANWILYHLEMKGNKWLPGTVLKKKNHI